MEFFASVGFVVAALFTSGADAASNVVQYTYDAAGNIVAIQRVNPASLTLARFTPTAGAVGTSVAINGTGFAATATQNVVAFNGVAATVTASSPTMLTVAVPAGATTGRISVSLAGNTVVSAQDFSVTTAGAPAIAAFTPSSGAAGTSVMVTGTNFNPAPGATTVKVNQSSRHRFRGHEHGACVCRPRRYRVRPNSCDDPSRECRQRQ